VFVGRQSDIENYYAAADILALPALQEAFGNVILEGLASGLPVLVSQQTGAAEVLSGRLRRGIVSAHESTDALQRTLVALLDTARDPDLCAAARRVGEEYSWKNHFEKLETLLTRVVGSRQDVA
jgi:glycosyltransferase involved in cell wall biosynthesis